LNANDNHALTTDLITIARRAYDRRLTAAAGGNISARIDENRFLISRSGSSFGFLTADDLLTVDMQANAVTGTGSPSSETPVHAAIYRELDADAVVHTHPPLISALALTNTPLTPLIFEHYVVLGEVPVIPQDGPNITDIPPIVEALKNNKVVILRHHGVIAIGGSLLEGFLLSDLLETSARTIMAVRSQGKETPLPGMFFKPAIKLAAHIPFFSEEHAAAVTERVRNDKDMAALGRTSGFTTTIVLCSTDTEQSWVLSLENGRLTDISSAASCRHGEILFSASREIWERIFTGRMNVIVGMYQGRVSLTGDVRRISQYYVPLQCLFACMRIER